MSVPNDSVCKARHRPLFWMIGVILTLMIASSAATGVGLKWQYDIGAEARAFAQEAKDQAQAAKDKAGEVETAEKVDNANRLALKESVDRLEKSVEKLTDRLDKSADKLERAAERLEKL